MSETLGQRVDRQGIPELFELVRQLAERDGRIPVGQWDRPLADGWRLRVNGTGEVWDGIPRWTASLEGTRNGWPVMAWVDPGGGSLIGMTEDEAIAVLQTALRTAGEGK